MQRKRLFIILGAISIIILLAWFTVFPVIKGLRAANSDSGKTITEITLCDIDAHDLCIVTFGVDNLDQMVINIQLPNTDYPAFYVHATNKGIKNIYQCEVANAIPTSVYCTGLRTPLGETLNIEIHAINGDLLMARGTLMVSAMVLTTPINFAAIPNSKIVTPTPFSGPAGVSPIEATPTVVFTSTPAVAYP